MSFVNIPYNGNPFFDDKGNIKMPNNDKGKGNNGCLPFIIGFIVFFGVLLYLMIVNCEC